MADSRADSLLALAADLDERDAALAAQIAVVAELAGRAGSVRGRAAEVRARLDAIPAEQVAAEAGEAQARQAERDALAELALAEERLQALEHARRRDDAAVATARSVALGAREAAADSAHRRERQEAHCAELRDEQETLRAEAERLAADAREVATSLRDAPRVADAGKGEPGATLAELEDWGGRARAALFVARGTLDNERERVVAEANALAGVVLGEQSGGASVAAVRRRVEEALA